MFSLSIKKCFLLFFVLCSLFVSAQNGLLKGTVKDSLTKGALPFVIVTMQDTSTKQFSVTTDQLGNFKFTKLHNGQYVLSISIIGYKSFSVPVRVDENQPMLEIAIELPRSAISLSLITVSGATKNMGQTLNVINQLDMLLRPINSAQDLMRLVPGLFLAQHQGGGKAEQIFLRGFDADHGTDFAVFWDGIPVNMPSHAHGQGYADSHFVIPETIDQVNVYKGDYATPIGDFATAGAAQFFTKNEINNMIKFEAGTYGYYRAMGILNLIGENKHLFSKYKETAYISAEGAYNAASYFVHPQDYSRFSVFGKYYGELSTKTVLTVEGSYFNATWHGSGQIPVRAITDGLITRFGAIDPSEGGQTDRTNANVILKTTFDNGSVLKNQLYYSYYQLNLFTDFTFFLVDTVHGDGINQRDKGRNIFGYNGTYEINGTLGGKSLKTVLGISTKIDMGQIGLMQQENRTILDTVSMGNLYEQNISAYVDETYYLTDKFFVNAGVRADYFYIQYKEITPAPVLPGLFPNPDSSGAVSKLKVSPKLNLYYNLNSNVQLFVKGGFGFHSNDARAVVSNPNVNTLPTAIGYEIGSLFKPVKGMLVNLELWGLNLQNELTYDQDVAQDVVNGPTLRLGVDFSVRYQITKYLYFDMDVEYSHGRFTDSLPGHNYIPLAPTLTSIAGITVKNAKGFSASLRYRYIDDRPADSQDQITAYGYFLLDGVVKYRLKKYELGVTVENILNVNWNEAQFETLTRLPGEGLGGVNQLCFTPGAPRLVKGSISYYF
jgi:outer membrane receptor protein involved in Fe transport